MGAFVLAVGVVAIALARGQQVCSVTVQGEITLAAQGEKCYDKEFLTRQQEALRQQAEAAKATMAPASVPAGELDLDGWWYGPGGASYEIHQSGSEFTIAEVTQGLGLTATGTGRIVASTVHITFTAVTGAPGTIDLQSSGRGVLTGTIRNGMGWSAPFVMQRG